MTGRPCVISNVTRGIGSTLMKPAVIIFPVIVNYGMHNPIDPVLSLTSKRITLRR